mmetsp:Transcript_11525/g.22070  ORF Transcript_11525/g.22070 Transcript_11525/m.22070 type:complete len:561 (-) Transcript_11525:1507-3189(-)|eukprot:scaffold425_cov175-Amphora_coffeaeformis.AAC.48
MAPQALHVKTLSRVAIFCLFAVILLFDRSFFKNYVEVKAQNKPEFAVGNAALPSIRSLHFPRCSNATTNSIHCLGQDRPGVPEISSQFNKTDWFRSGLWRKVCMEVEHVCHSTGRWWYKDVPNAHQPNLRFRAHKEFGAIVGYPSEIEVRAATDAVENLACTYSPVPNHLVLFAMYNDMLGEFYLRNVVGLIYMLSKEENMKDLLESTQLYLQLYNFDRSLLDSHYAFMASFLSHRLLSFKELLQSTSCSCVERMVFCGYKFQEDGNNNTYVTGSGGLEAVSFPGVKRHNDPKLFRGAQQFLREHAIISNPLVQRDIAEFRKAFLTQKGIKENFDDWKIIGLTQRSGRRKWLNIDDSIRMCEEKLRRNRILCMVVNVEEPHFHPTHHIIVHGSLDGLIGIHGAQLTDALWMKPGSLVVELLPYLTPSMVNGDWTRNSKEPTPLGEIYVGTDLYHVGLPLKWTSVPKCKAKRGEDFDACVKEKINRWSVRDFDADTNDVEEVIAKFARDRPDSCEEQKRLAGVERFVLYNALCDDDDGVQAHFFYWKRGLEHVETYSGFPK